MSFRDQLQELKELGVSGTAFRVGWELRSRSGVLGRPGPVPFRLAESSVAARDWTRRLPFADPPSVAAALRDRIPPEDLDELSREAEEAAIGRIRLALAA